MVGAAFSSYSVTRCFRLYQGLHVRTTTNRWGVLFGKETNNIRVVTLEGNPWFVAKDVCATLGLADFKGGVGHHLTSLGADEVTPSFKVGVKLGGRGEAHVRLISESGLYKLIMRSDKPQAKAFQDYVTKEILPSIRKTGSFVTGQPSLIENPQMDPPKGLGGKTP